MKTSIIAAAAALAFAATPAVAQTSPAGQHEHHGAAHSDHHAQHGAGNHSQHGTDHSKHKDCCGDKNGNGKMDCCEGKEAMPCCAKHTADKKRADAKR